MLIVGFILGTVLGSFVKVLADRSLTDKSFWGRSYCLRCKEKLRWYDLFPIISFIFLKGCCRYCKKSIKIEYLLVEAITGILVGFLFWQHLHNSQFSILNFQSIPSYQFSIFILELLFKTFFITILAALFLTDLKEMLIPDRISLPAIWISLIYLVGISFITNNTQPLLKSILSGLGIAIFFTLLIIVTKGKGMGGGDVKLGAFMGLMLGFPLALVAMVLSFLLGAVFSIFLIIAGKKHFGQAIPFGPFLVLGSLISLFWGNRIMDWYLRFGT